MRGIDGRTRVLAPAGASSSILELKGLVESEMGIPAEEVRLIHGGKDVSTNRRTLGELGIEKDSTLQVNLRLLGGDDDDETESESEEDEDTGLTENQNRLLYMISLYTKKATPGTDEKDEWVSSIISVGIHTR